MNLTKYFIAAVAASFLITSAHAQSDKNYDYSEARPIVATSGISCWHPDSFKKHIIKARKVKPLIVKLLKNKITHMVYINDHKEILFVIRGLPMRGTRLDCIVASIIADVDDTEGSGVFLDTELKLKAGKPLPRTEGPTGDIRKKEKT